MLGSTGPGHACPHPCVSLAQGRRPACSRRFLRLVKRLCEHGKARPKAYFEEHAKRGRLAGHHWSKRLHGDQTGLLRAFNLRVCLQPVEGAPARSPCLAEHSPRPLATQVGKRERPDSAVDPGRPLKSSASFGGNSVCGFRAVMVSGSVQAAAVVLSPTSSTQLAVPGPRQNSPRQLWLVPLLRTVLALKSRGWGSPKEDGGRVGSAKEARRGHRSRPSGPRDLSARGLVVQPGPGCPQQWQPRPASGISARDRFPP